VDFNKGEYIRKFSKSFGSPPTTAEEKATQDLINADVGARSGAGFSFAEGTRPDAGQKGTGKGYDTDDIGDSSQLPVKMKRAHADAATGHGDFKRTGQQSQSSNWKQPGKGKGRDPWSGEEHQQQMSQAEQQHEAQVAQQQLDYNNAHQAHVAQQAAAYNMQNAQALQANYAQQLAQQQAILHMQQGIYPAVTPIASAAATGHAGHMGQGGSMAPCSHAPAFPPAFPSWMQQPVQPHAAPIPAGYWDQQAPVRYAEQPGIYHHPAGAPVPAGFRLLNDGSGRVEKIATGGEA
jgi:hypothetical protein